MLARDTPATAGGHARREPGADHRHAQLNVAVTADPAPVRTATLAAVAVQLNHTIVAARDPEASARWFSRIFGVAQPSRFGHFWQIDTANGVALDFDVADEPITGTHYAFLVSEDEFDAIYGRIVEEGIDHWADPMARRPGEINHHDGGRGVYFPSPDGHYLEIITRPYGG
jgi:catechol 2,3-dioxygenase-like lactoylglutathione lyase family enzyme